MGLEMATDQEAGQVYWEREEVTCPAKVARGQSLRTMGWLSPDKGRNSKGRHQATWVTWK